MVPAQHLVGMRRMRAWMLDRYPSSSRTHLPLQAAPESRRQQLLDVRRGPAQLSWAAAGEPADNAAGADERRTDRRAVGRGALAGWGEDRGSQAPARAEVDRRSDRRALDQRGSVRAETVDENRDRIGSNRDAQLVATGRQRRRRSADSRK